LILATIAFAGGLVPGLIGPRSLAVGLLLAAALPLGLAMAGRGGARGILLLFLLLGAAAGLNARGRARTACAAGWRSSQTVALAGYLTAAPVAGRTVTFRPYGPPCAEPIQVALPRNAGEVSTLGGLRVRGTWQPIPLTGRWPRRAVRLGVLRLSSVTVDDRGPRPPLLVRLRLRAQHSLRQLLPRRHGVAEALVLARTEALEPGLRDTFAAAGMAHLLAISGAHVLVFAGALMLLLRLARFSAAGGRIVALLLVATYVAAIGAPPAAARAALQYGLLMAALLLQRPAHRWTAMAAAALALMVSDPLSVLDAGFQLSFAGVGGLLAYRRRCRDWLPGMLPASVRAGLATGLAATIATFPVAALHFGQFAPVGLIATLVAAPLVALALPGLALLLILACPAPILAGLIAPGIELVLGLFLALANLAATVPGGHFRVTSSTVATLLLLAAALLLARARARGRGERAPPVSPGAELGRRRQALLRSVQTAAAAAALVTWAPSLAPARGYLEVHMIDVGQGDAIALRTPHGRWLLVDAGDRTDRIDMGARRVVPYLLRRGVRRIDVLLLTHAHSDHIGGARSVLAAFDVRAVLDPGVPGASSQYLETLSAARTEPAPWLAPLAGSRLTLDGVQLNFLYPRAPLLDAPSDPNDFSLVFRLGFGHFAALFLGDAPRAVEQLLVAEHGNALAAAVLKVGHHGSSTATGPALLDAVEPRLALISVGRDNRFGHPDSAVVARLRNHGTRVLRTDQHGSIVIRAWRSGRIELGTSR